MRPKQVQVRLAIPFIGEISGTWEPDEAERRAAWELYVELVTRVAVVQLGPAEGLLREALSSLREVFAITREILRRYGPAVAPKTAEQEISFGYLAVGVLNGALRPLLVVWHPTLAAYEATRPDGVSPVDGSGNGPGPRSCGPSLQPPAGCSWSSPAPLEKWPVRPRYCPRTALDRLAKRDAALQRRLVNGQVIGAAQVADRQWRAARRPGCLRLLG